MAKTGVVLLNMGGPDSLEAIQPFLYNLFSDHDIIEIPRLIQKPVAYLISKTRAKSTRKYYELMGGKSPQKEQTLEQAKELQKALGDKYKVVVAMRYWHPFTEEALNELFKDDIDKIILLPLYPQYSRTTTGSSFNEFYRVFKKFNKNIPVIEIKSYFDYPTYIQALVENIKENLPDYKNYYFLFSAHSLPEKVIKEGDPYQLQVMKTVKLVMKHFPENEYNLAYQSKIGPVKWLEPFTDKEIERVAKEGIKNLAVIPISFVSEHSETLYELDIQYGNLAKEVGIENYVRIPTLQTSKTFIKALKELVENVKG
ncbi:ferrochelatase [Hydrogenothermus marinus]|uniref:Ferrochelatase n=1 Tax=Hydrogenothermus marinus TaxID=133270 RepID=A0A3M0BT34_9AQUI|nr:ferrochelatase [Hydrogenothermus marinus]RMA97675.1 ferrochelatase [Hydrogenothermus marinus]